MDELASSVTQASKNFPGARDLGTRVFHKLVASGALPFWQRSLRLGRLKLEVSLYRKRVPIKDRGSA